MHFSVVFIVYFTVKTQSPKTPAIAEIAIKWKQQHIIGQTRQMFMHVVHGLGGYTIGDTSHLIRNVESKWRNIKKLNWLSNIVFAGSISFLDQ